MQIQKVLVLVFLLLVTQLMAQDINQQATTGQSMDSDVKSFYAETKQVTQFIRRFNGEEDIQGKKLAFNDPDYHDASLRKKFISALFDEKNPSIAEPLKRAFINDVTSTDNPKLLDFHGGDWFGETYVKFKRGNQETFVTLFMELVKENLGSKWVISDVYY